MSESLSAGQKLLARIQALKAGVPVAHLDVPHPAMAADPDYLAPMPGEHDKVPYKGPIVEGELYLMLVDGVDPNDPEGYKRDNSDVYQIRITNQVKAYGSEMDQDDEYPSIYYLYGPDDSGYESEMSWEDGHSQECDPIVFIREKCVPDTPANREFYGEPNA